MASPEEVIPLLPDTLPEDFSEWDGAASAPLSPKVSGPQAVPFEGEGSRPLSQAPARGAGVAPGVGRPRGAGSPWSGPEISAPPEVPNPLADQVSRSVSYRLEPSRRFGEQAKGSGSANSGEGTAAATIERPRLAPSPLPAADDEEDSTDRMPEQTAVRAPQRAESRGTTVELPVSPVRSGVAKGHESKAAAMTDAAIVDLFREKPEPLEEESPSKKKQIVLAAVGACLLLLALLLIPLFRHGTKPVAAQPLQMSSAATYAQPVENLPKPHAGTSQATGKMAEDAAQSSTEDASASSGDQSDTNSEGTPVQSAMMDEQLSAPTRIAKQTNSAPVGNAPPPVNTAGLGGSAVNPGVFNGPGQPIVHMSPTSPIAISSGVANSLLIRKTPPIYPTIAKEARISGTVVLQAIISKSGTVKSLRVLNGPQMLRQAATDAVKTWRYKPYELNGQPVEMETAISIVFTLAG